MRFFVKTTFKLKFCTTIISISIALASSLDALAAQKPQNNTKKIEACVDKWIDAHRKEVGDDTVIFADQLKEWEGWCKKGKEPNVAVTGTNTIPKQFHGKWQTPEDCANGTPVVASDPGIEVKSKFIERIEEGCHLKKVIDSGSITFTGSFSCEGVDGKVGTNITLVLKNGKLSVDGQGPLPRCKH